ncbi:MAG: DNA mismatch repair endonuclease MutL, partial [Nanobdellota archaeon]
IASKIKEGEKFNFNHMKDNILKMMACRASEKAGDDLNIIQAKKIIDELFQFEGNPYNCPHGRPTIVEISIAEVEKMFKRKK